MQTRRQLLQRTAALSALAALAPLLSSSGWAAEGMLKRTIPSSGEALPVIGLGTSRVFNVGLDDAELEPLLTVLKTFLNGGARLIDTAPSYGRSEQVAGELVKRAAAPDKVFWATKVSSTGREAGLRQIEASFAALNAPIIDLIQVHNLQDTKTQLGLLRELKQQGRVRYLGITHYREAAHDDLLQVLRTEQVDFVQLNYSVDERNADRRLLPYCAEHGIATLINRPFTRGGLLSRVRERPLPAWAVEVDATSWAQLALKFILGQPGVTTVIPATSNPRYMADNLLAGQGRLPDQAQRQRILQAFA
jgi:aryl-alcohol dehydrogenase-like predicted oxidoreductase